MVKLVGQTGDVGSAHPLSLPRQSTLAVVLKVTCFRTFKVATGFKRHVFAVTTTICSTFTQTGRTHSKHRETYGLQITVVTAFATPTHLANESQMACVRPTLLESDSQFWTRFTSSGTHSACSKEFKQGPRKNAPPTCRPFLNEKRKGAMNGYVSIYSMMRTCTHVHMCHIQQRVPRVPSVCNLFST